MVYRFILIFMLVFSSYAFAGTPDSTTVDEINHLLTFITSSPCTFNRNGRWYKATEASEHIDKKYRYVLDKGLVNSAEDFITYAATKSSMSGKKYMVQCEDAEPITSSDWLKTELARYRSGR